MLIIFTTKQGDITNEISLCQVDLSEPNFQKTIRSIRKSNQCGRAVAEEIFRDLLKKTLGENPNTTVVEV